jgi:hypothetical protein
MRLNKQTPLSLRERSYDALEPMDLSWGKLIADLLRIHYGTVVDCNYDCLLLSDPFISARMECTVEIGSMVFGAREICTGILGVTLLITVAIVSMRNAISGGELGSEPLGEISGNSNPAPAPYVPADAYNDGARYSYSIRD